MSEHEDSGEREGLIIQEALKSICRELGFETSAELSQVEEEIVASREDIEKLRELLGTWSDKAERVVPNDTQGQARAHLANIIDRARIYERIGMTEQSQENIQDAIDYAANSGMDDLAERLEDMLI